MDFLFLENQIEKAQLTADQQYLYKDDFLQLCYFRKYSGEVDSEGFSIDGIWRIEAISSFDPDNAILVQSFD